MCFKFLDSSPALSQSAIFLSLLFQLCFVTYFDFESYQSLFIELPLDLTGAHKSVLSAFFFRCVCVCGGGWTSVILRYFNCLAWIGACQQSSKTTRATYKAAQGWLRTGWGKETDRTQTERRLWEGVGLPASLQIPGHTVQLP